MLDRAAGTSVSRAEDRQVSIVIPHYNDTANLDVCLRALQAQTIPLGSYEIVVADNNSSGDQTVLGAVCLGRARLIHAPIQGAAEARNAGVQASRFPLLAFIDSDCRPSARWIEQGLEALNGHPLVGGRVGVAARDERMLTPTEAFEKIFAFNNERYIQEEHFSVTANLFTSRAVFDHVGGFRTGVSEDLDWGRRAVALGYSWTYAAEALVEHPARHDWAALNRKWKRLMAESFALAVETGGGRIRWIVRNWMVLLATPLAIGEVLRSRRVSKVRDRLGAAAILVRSRCWRFVEAHRLALSRADEGTRRVGI